MEKETTSKKRNNKPTNTQSKKETTKIKNNENINVAIPLAFVKNINNILLIANQRTHWNPNELIPVGTILRELDGIINYYDKELEKSSRASAPESSRPS
tara:strand:- start:171 stop:467 length:297 start_codon:yes stop_codon:yes gene_type:complete